MKKRIAAPLAYGNLAWIVAAGVMYAFPGENVSFTFQFFIAICMGIIGAIIGYLVEIYMDTLDINSRGNYPANALSNLASHEFELDRIQCASMEGFLQSLKNPFEGNHLVKLSGIPAKATGQKYNDWKEDQALWWCDVWYDREKKEYQDLLDRAFEALATNKDFQKALLATEDKRLVHTIGISDITNTVLTEKEFCSRLTKLRKRLIAESGGI